MPDLLNMLDNLTLKPKKETFPGEKKIEIEVEKIPKKKLPKIREDVDFSNMTITQDDLWFLHRLKIGKGTRDKRSILLAKFTRVFIRNLNENKE